MTMTGSRYASSPPSGTAGSARHRTAASYERELAEHRRTEVRLRASLAREETLLRQKDDLLHLQEVMGSESDHRLLNGLQMIVSLLSLQSRSSANGETASQLAVAANRVSMIERVHRRLHCLDGEKTVAFKQFLEDLCRDFSAMVGSPEHPEQAITVEGSEIELPAATAVPLGFIVNELITNAAKYGKGRITVRLEADPALRRTLSVFNDGPCLPDGFDPVHCKGLGMKIVQSFVEQIGGELRIGRNDDGHGARFAVLFS